MAIALGKKNNNRGIVGLDLDGEFIAAVQTSSDGISRAVSAELPPGVITDGEVTDVPALSDALLLDLREVAVGAELLGLGLETLGLRLGLAHLGASRVDRVQREDVDEHAHENEAERAEHEVGAALAAAGRLARAMLLGKKVDRLHAAAPSARPVATVWR